MPEHYTSLLCEHNTFLHVRDPDNDAHKLGRSRSDPCIAEVSSSDCPGAVSQSAKLPMKFMTLSESSTKGSCSDDEPSPLPYQSGQPEVEELPNINTVIKLDSGIGQEDFPEIAAPALAGPVSRDERIAWSVGAKYHHLGQCSPCAWNWKSTGCDQGKLCVFCHLCPIGAVKAKKKARVAALKATQNVAAKQDALRQHDKEAASSCGAVTPRLSAEQLCVAQTPQTGISWNISSLNFLQAAVVRNTFLEFPGRGHTTEGRDDDDEDDENEWFVCTPRRQMTDSSLQINAFRTQLEQRIFPGLQAETSSRHAVASSSNFLHASTSAWATCAGSNKQERFTKKKAASLTKTLAGSTPSRQISSEEPEPIVLPGSHPMTDVEPEMGAPSHNAAVGEVSPEQRALRLIASIQLQAMQEIALKGAGLSGCTTLMVRHIPLKYTQHKLIREVNGMGFIAKYDFFYLPTKRGDRRRKNRGCVYMNFTNADAADEFYQQLHGQKLKNFDSENPLAVLPADLQGFEANILRHVSASARLHRVKQAGHTKPIVLRSLPSHLAEQLQDVNLAEVFEFGTHPFGQTSSITAPIVPVAAMSTAAESTMGDPCFAAGPKVPCDKRVLSHNTTDAPGGSRNQCENGVPQAWMPGAQIQQALITVA